MMPSPWRVSSLLLLLLLALPAAPAGTVKIERMSPPPLDLEVPVPGTSPAISADGRFVAFVVEAGNIYVRDRQSGKTELVSVSTSGAPANGHSYSPAISADGRFVAFASDATNLVPGDTNNATDVFLRDRQTGKTELVSVSTSGAPADNGSYTPAISADGRFVAFVSGADNLVPGDTNGAWDVFVRDRQSGKTELVSVSTSGAPANGNSGSYLFDGPAISADGRFVAFGSYASNLVPGDTNDQLDIFVRDRVTATTEVITAPVNVSRVPLDSGQPAISADGQWVVFVTAGQVFERNRITGSAALVSATAGGSPANSLSNSPAISADGRFVAFQSYATNLVPGDTRGDDILVWDRQTGKTELVSVSTSGEPANNGSYSPSISGPAISADGRFVAFGSYASNLVPGDTNNTYDIFLRDRQTGTTELVSTSGAPANNGSASPAISADGRFVAFASYASNLVPGDTNGKADVFVAERE